MWNNNVIFLRKGILSPETMNKISSVKHNDHAFVIFAVFFNVHGTSPPQIPNRSKRYRACSDVAEGVGFEPTDRLNTDQTISSRSRYDHFDSPPYDAARVFVRQHL